MKKSVLKRGITFFVFSLIVTSVQAQYGGSAYVYAKSRSGVSQVLHATWPNTKDNESQVKTELKGQLQRLLYVIGGEFTSGINYSTEYKRENSKNYYGGSAWVRVKNMNGEIRTINTEISCTKNGPSNAKGELLSSIRRLMKSDEVFETYIRYDIDTCK